MTLNGSSPTPRRGPSSSGVRRVTLNRRGNCESRSSARCVNLFGLRLHDWMFRRDLALNSGIGFFSLELMNSGDQSFWEA